MIGILVRYIVVFLVIAIFMWAAKTIVRKAFGIPKEPEGSRTQNYVKQRFDEVDQQVKNYTWVVLFAVLVVNVAYFPQSYAFIIAVFLYTATRMLIKAYIERKYSTVPRQALVTITELAVLTASLIIILNFNLL
ncbi:hypothetical protein NCCP2716_27100 [Sporosarcina sp. NCCP-2716]|nr:hypothetical protein NCCP2716_27100 [Sporosarcina sp. NCCP-2716]